MRALLILCLLRGYCFSEQKIVHIQAAAAEYQAGRKAIVEGNWAQATQLFQKAIEIEPTFREAYEALIEADLKTEHRLEAGAALTRLLQIEPKLISQRLQLAHILQEQNQHERALAQYAIVLKQAPANADALAGFAAMAQQLGMAERAQEALAQGRKLYPADRRFQSTNSKPNER